MFAERNIEPGRPLFSELPIVLTPNPPLPRSVSHRVHHADVCFNCMRSLAPPSQALAPNVRKRMSLPLADRFWPRSDARNACPSCNSQCVVSLHVLDRLIAPSFCSPECQQTSGTIHARLCKSSALLAPILEFCKYESPLVCAL